jgi:hypothetical protein
MVDDLDVGFCFERGIHRLLIRVHRSATSGTTTWTSGDGALADGRRSAPLPRESNARMRSEKFAIIALVE